MTILSRIDILEKFSYVFTVVFLFVVISYYILFFLKERKGKKEKSFSSVTIIIPAHNEEKHIEECIVSILKASFEGWKEIIVVDDGSSDNTSRICIKFKKVTLIKTRHSGKSASINRALGMARGEIIAIVDADSMIQEDSLMLMKTEIEKENVAAVSCVIKVSNRKRFIGMWLHIEQLYNSLMRSLFSKINANITVPGPLSLYRKKELLSIKGFNTKSLSEDTDVGVRLIRKGYRIRFAEKAFVETYMPDDIKGFFRQRSRFAKGITNIFKKHIRINNTSIDLYTFPILFFTYAQAVIMGSFIIYQILSGYFMYFASKGIYFNFSVLKFFFEWLSIVGFFRWIYSVFINHSFGLVTVAGIISTLLTYPLYIISILKFDRKIDFWHIVPVFFMFPFWLLIMSVYIFWIPEYFKKEQKNIWNKNEQ